MGQAEWLAVIAVVQLLLLLVLLGVTIALLPRLLKLTGGLSVVFDRLEHTLHSVERLVSSLRESGLIEQTRVALRKAEGTVTQLDPVASDLRLTLTEARSLLDDATQTSQAVRARVEDLAATQRELNALASSLAEVAGDVRNQELAAKLGNVLHDTSLLAADLGVLAENANSYLETGRPLVREVSNVVDSARQRADGIAAKLGGVREGIRAGVRTWKEGGQQ